jgi:YVTN family beta-propeller protein
LRGAAAVDVIDTATLLKEKTILTGKEPGGMAITPDRTRIVAVATAERRLSVINIRTEAVEFSMPVSGAPVDVAFEADKSLVIRRLFVLLAGGDGIEIMDYAQRKPVGKVAGPARGIAVSPDRRTLWTSVADGVTVYSLPDLRKVTTVPVGKGAGEIVFMADGRRALVTSEIDGSMSVVDALAYREMTRVPVGQGPTGMAIVE